MLNDAKNQIQKQGITELWAAENFVIKLFVQKADGSSRCCLLPSMLGRLPELAAAVLHRSIRKLLNESLFICLLNS